MSTPGTHPKQGFGGLPALLLTLTVLLALVIAAAIGAEFYARGKANTLIADAVKCEADDTATVSFATTPPVLSQYINGHYPNISIHTAGNQLRQAKGMKLDLDLHNIRVHKTADSKGTIGSLSGTLTWTSDGIKESVQSVVPGIGNLVASNVTTNPADGTLELKGLLDHATIHPQVTDGKLQLEVTSLSALGLGLDTDKVQTNLDELTDKATKDLPLGIKITGVSVTDTGLTADFAAQDSTIPAQSSSDCFAKL